MIHIFSVVVCLFIHPFLHSLIQTSQSIKFNVNIYIIQTICFEFENRDVCSVLCSEVKLM